MTPSASSNPTFTSTFTPISISADNNNPSYTCSHDTFTRQVLRQIRNATPSSSLGTSVNPLDKAAQKPGYGSNKSGQGKKAIGKSTTESCFNSS